MIVQPSQAEKNRNAQIQERLINKTDKGPMRLYVGSLHFNITEEMLRGIFEPFGRIQSIQLILDMVIKKNICFTLYSTLGSRYRAEMTSYYKVSLSGRFSINKRPERGPITRP